jgi:hypothetical protein
MKFIADRILELLHHSDTEPIFVNFCEELKLLESPIHKVKVGKEGSIVQYVLPELGVSIYSLDTRIFSAHFYIEPTSTEGITTLPYCNELPFGLRTDYKINDVHDSLGPPHEVTNPSGLWTQSYHNSESYSLEDWDLTFWYSKPDKKLATLIIHRHQTLPER